MPDQNTKASPEPHARAQGAGKRLESCPDCGGTGSVTGGGANYPGKRTNYGDCETCDGRGSVEVELEEEEDA